MNHARHGPILGGIALLVAVSLAAEGWRLAEARRTVQTATRATTRKQQEWRRLASSTPAPTAAHSAAIDADLARAEARLAALEAAVWSRAATAGLQATTGRPPGSRTEAFFDLAEFARRMRELAASAGVLVRVGEGFGFSAYRHAGPEPDAIAPVLRQRQVAGYLLENLFASRIRQLISVQRARPTPPGGAIAGAALNGHGEAPARTEFFEIDPRCSLRAQGVVETVAFRLTFIGRTAALRGFLNRLASGGMPVIVRTVEAEPVRDAPPPRTAAAGSSDPLEPIVRPAWSRFTVTLESCEPIPPQAEAGSTTGAPSPAAGPAPRLWPEPPAQTRGRGWVFEVFTPPALYYDRRAAAVNAIAVTETPPADPADAEVDLQLLEVRRGPYRLQLVGYAGGPEDLRGIFVLPDTGETLIGHGGERLAAQGLRVKSINLSRPVSGANDGSATTETMATALVEDEATGDEVVLTDRGPCLAGSPLGLFASRTTPGFRRELKEGESVALNGASYCATHIDLQPPQVVIARILPGATEPRLITLMPARAPAAGEQMSPPTASEGTTQTPPRRP